MIEKVAKAIFIADYPNVEWERYKVGDVVYLRYIKLARAAIEAMKNLYKCIPGPNGNKRSHDKLNDAIDIILKE